MIPKVGQKSEANQQCRTIMLGTTGRVQAMPTLEITADDVACSHGAAIADLDQNSLFYVASRGINPKVNQTLEFHIVTNIIRCAYFVL